MAADREPLLDVGGLTVTYPISSGAFFADEKFEAVRSLTFHIHRGETLALVGESGCGKSTVARAIAGLVRPAAGTITFEGRDITRLPRSQRRVLARDIQMVFQDPYSSLHPRMTAEQAIGEGWRAHPERAPRNREQALADLFGQVGLAAADRRKYAHEFSGGQRQRISIARALALSPSLVILDEPVSALDVSVQAQVLLLLADLQREHGLAYLFISHDLDVVGQISDRTMTMYLGTLFESGRTEAVLGDPIHPYSQALLASAPSLEDARPGSGRSRLHGEMPSPIAPPSGCRLRTRCWLAEPGCADAEPALRQWPDGRLVACHVQSRKLGLSRPAGGGRSVH